MLALPHTIADDFTTPELHFIAVECEVFFNFNKQLSIRQTDAVARGRAKHVGIGLP